MSKKSEALYQLNMHINSSNFKLNKTTTIMNIDDLKTIKEIIKKQSKRIKEKEILYQKALSDLVIAEKMIDEMADLFLTIAKNNPGTIFHYLEKDGFSTKECSPCGEQKKDKNWTCAECFKEYFRKKGENG